MNFSMDIYRTIVNDRMERLQKEAYENNSFFRKKRSNKWKMENALFLSLFLKRRKAK